MESRHKATELINADISATSWSSNASFTTAVESLPSAVCAFLLLLHETNDAKPMAIITISIEDLIFFILNSATL